MTDIESRWQIARRTMRYPDTEDARCMFLSGARMALQEVLEAICRDGLSDDEARKLMALNNGLDAFARRTFRETMQ